MYSVAYVVVDDEELKIYNEMMKSIVSLRMRMPRTTVFVLTDFDTYRYLKDIDAEIFHIATVKGINIVGDYSQVEKSRYLKTNARKFIKGDFLYIDTDTVICDVFPDIISDASIALVLELHYPKSIAKSPYADLYDEKCAIEKTDYDLYYNSGVIWAKDDAIAHDFFSRWYNKWEETRKCGLFRDQPPLNYVIRSMPEKVKMLAGIWNVQISTRVFAPIHLLADAHIIHYMDNDWSAYLLCRPEYKNLPYNDPVILEMLSRPRTLFDRCRLLRLDNDNQFAETDLRDKEKEINEYRYIKKTLQFHLFEKLRKHEILFNMNEKVLGRIYRLYRKRS